MVGHVGFLVAGVATAPGGATFLIMSNIFKMMFQEVLIPEELEPLINSMVFGFFIAGLCLLIVGSTLLCIGLYKYRHRYDVYDKY